MGKRTSSKNKKLTSPRRPSAGSNLLLTLTLVPLIIGVLLIGAWALDIMILEDDQSQITVGFLFFLLSFTASNALQKRWRLAAGWGLLMCADLVLLGWLELWAQVVAIGFGLVGLILLAVEFYMQYQQGKVEKAKK